MERKLATRMLQIMVKVKPLRVTKPEARKRKSKI